MMENNYYINLIPYHFRQKPIFLTVLKVLLQGQQDINEVGYRILKDIKLNNTKSYPLNLLGQILNVSRLVSPALLAPSFSWNIFGLGWNQTNWSVGSREETSLLENNLYVYLVKFKAKFIHWDGSNQQLKEFINYVFKDVFTVELKDNLNMTLNVYCTFKEACPFDLKQLILNGSLNIYLTGVKLVWEDITNVVE